MVSSAVHGADAEPLGVLPIVLPSSELGTSLIAKFHINPGSILRALWETFYGHIRVQHHHIYQKSRMRKGSMQPVDILGCLTTSEYSSGG